MMNIIFYIYKIFRSISRYLADLLVSRIPLHIVSSTKCQHGKAIKEKQQSQKQKNMKRDKYFLIDYILNESPLHVAGAYLLVNFKNTI